MIEIRCPLVAAATGIVGEQLGDEQASSPDVHKVLGHRLQETQVDEASVAG